ncbi:MAG: phosphatase PAP2 family protein [Clostridia bacterium]|nr:phosphatase PAP2 family protein [Clostridia bacterium]
MLLAFVLWTVSVCFVDVRAIGPQGSAVGFAALNESVHRLTGVNMTLYTVTDWLGLVPIAVAFGFSVFGAVQWGKRKALRKVDRSILLLGGFYVLVMAVYVLFEILVINYRPVLINGFLEPSYPSSTTVLVLCVMPTAMMQLRARIKKNAFRRLGTLAIVAFIAFMVIGRLLSGVHWATDILGGIFFSSGMVLLYASVSGLAAGDA